MKIRYKLENPNAMMATLTLSMSVWPASKLSEVIGQVLRSARREIYCNEEKDGLE